MKNSAPKTIKIVTVDDSLMIAERLETLLADLANVNYLGNARTIASALTLVEEVDPHVVILDINLDDHTPLNNGIKLLTILKKTYSAITVIMLTNLSGDYYRTRCMDLGADYFLDKSNDFEKISGVLAKLNQ